MKATGQGSTPGGGPGDHRDGFGASVVEAEAGGGAVSASTEAGATGHRVPSALPFLVGMLVGAFLGALYATGDLPVSVGAAMAVGASAGAALAMFYGTILAVALMVALVLVGAGVGMVVFLTGADALLVRWRAWRRWRR